MLRSNLVETSEKWEKTIQDHRGAVKGSKTVAKEDGLSMNEVERGA